MTLNWNPDISKFIRGSDIEAIVDASDITLLKRPLVAAWNQTFEIGRRFRKLGPFSIIIEVWADTGRIIFRLSDKKEFGRLIVNIPELERCYYNLPKANDFEFNQQYCALVNSVIAQLQLSLPNDYHLGIEDPIHLVARDTDAKETEVNIIKNEF